MRKKDDGFDAVWGSPGNILRNNFDRAATDVQQTKATLAARITGILDDEGLSPDPAKRVPGLA